MNISVLILSQYFSSYLIFSFHQFSSIFIGIIIYFSDRTHSNSIASLLILVHTIVYLCILYFTLYGLIMFLEDRKMIFYAYSEYKIKFRGLEYHKMSKTRVYYIRFLLKQH